MKIGIMGGYGFNNIGDEAQLSACLKSFKDQGFLDIVVFTPNQNFTAEYHNVKTLEASRKSLFGEDRFPFYSAIFPRFSFHPRVLAKSLMAFPLFAIGLFVILSASSYRLFNTTIGFGTFIRNIAALDTLHFSGGGYFTKDTFSRLIDFCFVMILCRIFSVEVNMSGQTLGLWDNRVLKSFVKFSMKAVKSISLRDVEKSKKYIDDLELGIKVLEVCDDAYGVDVKKNQDKEYVLLHFHYWGHSRNPDYHARINSFYTEIVDNLQKKGMKCLLMSMTPTDDEALEKFSRVHSLACSLSTDSFSTKMIYFSECAGVITMKHHPIIFGFLFEKPVVSFYDSPYYEQKNNGAFKSVSIPLRNYNLNSVSVKEFCSSFPYSFDINYCVEVQRKILQRQNWFLDTYGIHSTTNT